jgi:N6-L-threonylcarbamoyladenine synthase
LAFGAGKKLIGVNHLEGHIFANFLAFPELEPPFVALIVSGGHTALIHVLGYNQFVLLGQTRDDAAGEAFDKIARVMGLPYPGGPYLEKLATLGNPAAVHFPRALGGDNLEFSFSGLKSAVLNQLNNSRQRGGRGNDADIAASFQAAVVDSLVTKTMQALAGCGEGKLVVAGGVAANSQLRDQLSTSCASQAVQLYYPPAALCTDNAAMIACRAYYQHRVGDWSPLSLNAVPSLKVGELK